MTRLIESRDRPLQVRDGKTLSGIFAVTDVFNQNGRRYPESVYEEAYKEILPKIQNRSLLGELDHPLERDEVFLSNVSHVITECHVGTDSKGHKVYRGKVELLDTPAGKIAQALVQAGIPIGISSRGVGATRKVSEGTEVTQFKLITWDLVAEPSFKIALLSEDKKSGLSESLTLIESKLPLNESKEYDSIRERINTIRESLRLTESGVNHTSEHEVQTLECNALKSLLETKSRVVAADTERLKEFRQRQKSDAKRISELERDLKTMTQRYTNIHENHQRLQEGFNNLQSTHEKNVNRIIAEKDAQILDLQKRLAVEKRGMSYSQVEGLLEGLTTTSEIEQRLDTVSSMSKKSTSLTEGYVASVASQIKPQQTTRSPLSRVISRV